MEFCLNRVRITCEIGLTLSGKNAIIAIVDIDMQIIIVIF